MEPSSVVARTARKATSTTVTSMRLMARPSCCTTTDSRVSSSNASPRVTRNFI